jgi:hypothetical protein
MDPDSLSPVNVHHIGAHTETSFLEAMQESLLYPPSRALLLGNPTNAYQEGHPVLRDVLSTL